MAKPVWITPAGSLGVIPEDVFYQSNLLADTEPLPLNIVCTATTAGVNVVTCNSTQGLYAGLNIEFRGDTFGGINNFTRYFVHSVIGPTEFKLSPVESLETVIPLTSAVGSMSTIVTQHVYYILQAGRLPPGIQVSDNGLIVGVPKAVASIQGVPFDVAEDVTSKFVIRAYTLTADFEVEAIADRTFTLTVTGNDVPEFATPSGSIGTFYDSDRVEFQFEIVGLDPGDVNAVRLVSGQLPGGLTLSPSGFLSGYIQPTPNVDEPAGYDLTPSGSAPYDFLVSAISKNFEFVLEVSDGKSSTLRTFSMFVYDRASLTADDTSYTADTTTLTADQTPERRPFIINSTPSNLGRTRGDNYYAYQFRADDYDTTDLTFAIAVNRGVGQVPGLVLDPTSGWYYGYIPDVGVTETEYSFNIYVRQTEYIGTPIECTATSAGTNVITCDSTEQLGPGTAVVFSGTEFGGISTAATQIYFVKQVISPTEFTVTSNLVLNPDYPQEMPQWLPADSASNLTSAVGSGLFCNLVVASDPYPFEITVVGQVDTEVIWLTPENLGTIENGEISRLVVQAENVGGRELMYRLKTGAFNELPQGLELLPNGEIVGQVTFNTFAIDLGATTFDKQTAVTLNPDIGETTWDSSFEFTVNAYAPDTGNLVYDVESIRIIDGGSGYSPVNTPIIEISQPEVGATSSVATVGSVTVESGSIVAVGLSSTGSGYASPATADVVAGFGGSGAVLEPVMREVGTVDVVSVFKTFRVKLIRAYNAPYQNLTVQAMPSESDRVLIDSLLDNSDIFVPDYIYRASDPNFGLATRVTYQHAFGLAPATLDDYVSSLYLNHYWKNLVLGPIRTAQALDDRGQVVYEVVYSQVIDDLTNTQGESVSKIVNLPYPVPDPAAPWSEVTQVYPNSLQNMRDQVIDTIGQISSKLPLWMTSKQANGRVLGFTPAWVICYTKPGRSNEIAYNINSQFGQQLNRVDFEVDRYILNQVLSRNWDPETQDWTPEPSQTTFDRFATPGKQFLSTVDIATQMPFADVNARTVEYINQRGGLDGEISQINGSTLIFVRQEAYEDYATTNDAWQNYAVTFDSPPEFDKTDTEFDQSQLVPGGYTVTCTETISASDQIACDSTDNMAVGDAVWFTGDSLSGLVAVTGTNVYRILEVVDSTHFVLEDPTDPGVPLSLISDSGVMTASFGNQRMYVWTISVDPDTDIVTLTPTEPAGQDQYVVVERGRQFGGVQLYYPSAPAPGLTRVAWQVVTESSTTETIWDHGSVAWVEPVDMYDPTDRFDKYLVFPKTNILA